MRRKLDEVKNRNRQIIEEHIELTTPEQTRAIGEVKEAIENLQKTITDTPELDLTEVKEAIQGLTDQLSLKEQLEQIKSVLEDREFTIKNAETLINAIKEIKPLVKLVGDDPTLAYKFSDADDDDSTKYYGYISKSGSWYIMRVTDESARYKFGAREYEKMWGLRRGHQYKPYNEAVNV